MLAFSTSGYICSPRVREVFRNPVMFCVAPLDNLYAVPLGQRQVARGYPGLESSPSPLPQSSAGSGSTTSHSDDIPRLGPSLQLCPTHILIQTKVFLHSGNSQQDLSTSAAISYPFAQLLMQLCYPAVRNSFPEAQLCLISLLNPFTPDTCSVFSSGRVGLRSWLCG